MTEKQMMRVEKNPFPKKGVISLGGTIEQKLRTLPTEQFQQVANLAVDYLKDGIGQIITISGPYGSGKTHLIYYAMEAVRKRPILDTDAQRFVQIYAKTENAEFVSLYRQLIRQIDYSLLREVNVRFLGIIAREELCRKEEKSKALLEQLPEDRKEAIWAAYEKSEQQAIENLRTNPDIVFKYLDNLIIPPETVLGRRASDLEKIAGENFKKAFFYLDDIDLGKIAYEWFVGERMSDTNLRRLGVSGTLNTADEAKYALRLLVTLFRHAGILLLIYIDQLERLLTGTDRKTAEENAGQLHSLAEFFPRENAFLALSGSDEGWSQMTRDFTSRIGPTQIVMELITREQSRDLAKIYLQEGEEYSPFKEPSDIAPFSLNGVDEVFRLRGGNMRRFLQTCHAAYAKYMKEGGIIGPDLVREVVKEERELFDHQRVSNEIQSVLRRKNLKFAQQAKLMDIFQPDFVIGEVKNPSVVIEISESRFYKDEADEALRIVNFREDLLDNYPKTKLIVIPMGYVSPEVLNHLRGVVDRCIVYEVEGFTEMLEAAIDSLVAPEKEVLRPEVDQRIKNELETVKKYLEVLLSTRESEIEALNMRLETFLRTQTEERQKGISAQHHVEWRSWLRQDQQRWEQRQTELKQKADDERRRLQREGEELRWRQSKVSSIPYLLVSGSAALLTYIFLTSVEVFHPSLRGPFSFGLGAFMMAYFYILFIHRRLFPLGFRTSDEVATFSGDIRQLALRAGTSFVSRLQASRCIQNPNPLIQYFGVHVCLTKYKDALPDLQWGDKAISETWIPLYLVYLKLIMAKEPKMLRKHLDLLLEVNPEDPRIVYAISALSESSRSEILNRDLLSRYLSDYRYAKVLAHAIFEGFFEKLDADLAKVYDELHIMIKFACAYSLMENHPADSEIDELANRFRKFGRFWNEDTEAPLKLKLTEDELRTIINTLSPHQEFGLASFQELPISNLYLRLYRFFAEIEWRLDHGDVALGL